VAEAFLSSRLSADHGYTFGTLPGSVDVKTILEQEIQCVET